MNAKDYLKRHNIDDQFIKQTKYVMNKGALLSEFLEDYYEMKTEALAIPRVSKSVCVQTGLECGFPCHSECPLYEKQKLR